MSETTKGSRAKDWRGMSKADRKAYNKEILEFYLKNGWRDTLSTFSLAPIQGARIISEKAKAKRKEIEKEEKKADRAEKKLNRKKTKKNPNAPEPAPKKRGRPKKTEGKAAKPVKAPKAKRGSKKAIAGNVEEALDCLLRYRKESGPVSLDEAIVELTIMSRAA